METIFILRNTKVIRIVGYGRIVYLDASDFERLDRCKDEECFIAGLSPKQVRLVGNPKQGKITLLRST
jgi:hypothetical protein